MSLKEKFEKVKSLAHDIFRQSLKCARLRLGEELTFQEAETRASSES